MIAYYGHSLIGFLGAIADSAWRHVCGERWQPCRKCGAGLSNRPGNMHRCIGQKPGVIERNFGACEWIHEDERQARWNTVERQRARQFASDVSQ